MADSGERAARVRFPPPLVYLLAVFAGLAVGYWVAAAPVPIDRTLRITVGALLAIAGVALAASARIHFLRTGQSVIPWTPTPELIFQGPYRFTRNPMYTGLTLQYLGLSALLDSAWPIIVLPIVLVILFKTVITREELYLTDAFGVEYNEYVARVRRWL